MVLTFMDLISQGIRESSVLGTSGYSCEAELSEWTRIAHWGRKKA